MNDLIRRQDAFEELKKEYNRKGAESGWEPGFGLKLAWIEKAINSVPEAKPDVPDINVGDMISRQDVIDAIGERPLSWTQSEYEMGLQNQYDSDLEAIQCVSSANPWIPCSERLPEKDGDYLTFGKWDSEEDFSVQIIPFDSCAEKFGIWKEYINPFSLGFEDSELIEAEVKAWMPLPDPWKGDQS